MSWDVLIYLIYVILAILSAADLSAVILGSVLIAKFKKRYAFYGSGMILSGLYSFTLLMLRFINPLLHLSLERMVVTSVISSLLIVIAVILFFLHARNNYGSKGLIVIIPVLILSKIPVYILTNYINGQTTRKGFETASLISLLNGLGIIAVLIYTALIYRKNRDKETGAPKFWIFMLIAAIAFSFDLLFRTELYIPYHIGDISLTISAFYLIRSLKKETKELEE